jgi:fermentation-respiration switch protein FrsA (DUF1100 family)
MKRSAVILLLVVSSAFAQVKPTPGPDDIPKAVPGGVSLAGATCPDIARYLNVRSAGGASRNPADREFFRQLSPLTHVDQVKAPLMVVHGANDPRDPVSEADQFVRAIRDRNGDVEYLRFPDEGHGVRKLSNRIILYRRVAAFLERTLGAGVTQCGTGS